MNHELPSNVSLSNSLEQATGPIEYGFRNDYMFRAILQQNQSVLKALICSLLHIDASEIKSLYIVNPIILGQRIDSKEFILDIRVTMNDNTHIDLEMQVRNQDNWTDRSLSYLCRGFDHLARGEHYNITGAAIHIGFLDFTPFPEAPEFYAKYKLLNTKNHRLYTGKFELNVLDLTQIELATDEDKAYGIDHWAKLFKATTWEDLKMIAEKDAALREATETLYALNCDETVRDMCRAREDAIAHEIYVNKKLAEQESLLAEQESLLVERESLLAKQESLLTERESLLAEQESLLTEQESQLAEKDRIIKQLQAQLAKKE